MTNSISKQQHCNGSNSRLAEQTSSSGRNISLADPKPPRSGKVDGPGGKEEEEVVHRLWSMLYADDVGIVSRSSQRLEKMMTVIVTAWSAFGLTVYQAKTEIMCLQTKYCRRVSFAINTADRVYKK